MIDLYHPEIMTTKEASQIWGINDSTIRKKIDQFPTGTHRKIGKTHIVTFEGMKEIFGDPKEIPYHIAILQIAKEG